MRRLVLLWAFTVVAAAALPLPAVAQANRPAAAPAGASTATPHRFGYRLIDRYSQSRRRFIAESDETRPGSTHGDWYQFEPSAGWVPPNVQPGQSWSATFMARDGAPPSRVDMKGEAGRLTQLKLPSGTFEVMPLVYKGWADRIAGHQNTLPHRVEFKLWYHPQWRRVIAFESDITASSAGALQGRNSRERVELTRLNPDDDFIEFGED